MCGSHQGRAQCREACPSLFHLSLRGRRGHRLTYLLRRKQAGRPTRETASTTWSGPQEDNLPGSPRSEMIHDREDAMLSERSWRAGASG